MPIARIDLIEGKSVEYRQTIASTVYDQQIKVLGVPADRFQVIHEHKPENLLVDPDYLGIKRSENCIFIQLWTLDAPTADQKTEFYTAVVNDLVDKLQVRPEDVFFSLDQTDSDDWSMGLGHNTYLNGIPKDRLDPDSV